MYIKKRLLNRQYLTSYSTQTAITEEKKMTENDSGIEVILEVDESVFENISVVSEQISCEEDEEYEQINGQLGLAAIFNFKKHVHNLRLDKDTLLLKECFESIGYNVREDHNNTTKKNLIKKLKAISSEDFSKKSSLIIIILTQGGLEGNFYTPDGDYITSWEIIDIFTSTTIHPSLKNKPKIFIIQSCKYLNKTQYLAEAEKVFTPKFSSTFKLPTEQHILLAYGIIEGNIMERTKNGSFYIQELCKNIIMYGKQEDICSLLIRTSRCVDHHNKRSKKKFIYKQIPSFISTLTKKFYICKNIEAVTINTNVTQNYEIVNKNLKEKILELESIISQKTVDEFKSDNSMINTTFVSNNNGKENIDSIQEGMHLEKQNISSHDQNLCTTDSATQTFDYRLEENQVELSMSKLCMKCYTKLYDFRIIFFVISIIMIFISCSNYYYNQPEEDESSYDWFNANMQHYTDLLVNFVRNK